MRFFILALALSLYTAPAVAQTVRCQLTDPEALKEWVGPLGTWGYGLNGKCLLESDPEAPQRVTRRTDRLRFWPQESVSVFIGGGPTSAPPWHGQFVAPTYNQSFEIVQQRIASNKVRTVLRTAYNGWTTVSDWRETTGGTAVLVFRLNYSAATSDDVAILRGTLQRLPSSRSWDREDDRNCENDAPGRMSLYCLLATLTKEQMGRYHHSQPALEVVRWVINRRWPERLKGHGLMDFNNNPATTLQDLREVLELSLVQAREEVSLIQ